MRKFKIFTTVLILYEFVILMILHTHHYCVSIFNTGFCNTSFKYFLMCIVIPTLFVLIAWWWPDMKRKMCNKCQCETKEESVKYVLKEDIEHLITALIITGIQKFISKHSKTTKVFNDVLKMFAKSNTTNNLTK